ncbi:MAG: hypothetical protein OHK0012_13550 [Synechococcales cyanobacterium]
MDDWKTWDALSLDERDNLPPQSGIYIVVDDKDNVWYVGQATNLNNRWLGHSHHRFLQLRRSNTNRHYRIHWCFYPTEELDRVEKSFIQHYRPLLNNSEVKTYSLGKPQL